MAMTKEELEECIDTYFGCTLEQFLEVLGSCLTDNLAITGDQEVGPFTVTHTEVDGDEVVFEVDVVDLTTDGDVATLTVNGVTCELLKGSDVLVVEGDTTTGPFTVTHTAVDGTPESFEVAVAEVVDNDDGTGTVTINGVACVFVKGPLLYAPFDEAVHVPGQPVTTVPIPGASADPVNIVTIDDTPIVPDQGPNGDAYCLQEGLLDCNGNPIPKGTPVVKVADVTAYFEQNLHNFGSFTSDDGDFGLEGEDVVLIEPAAALTDSDCAKCYLTYGTHHAEMEIATDGIQFTLGIRHVGSDGNNYGGQHVVFGESHTDGVPASMDVGNNRHKKFTLQPGESIDLVPQVEFQWNTRSGKQIGDDGNERIDNLQSRIDVWCIGIAP